MNQHVYERLTLTGQVRIHIPEIRTSPVDHALRMLVRDFEAVLGAKPELITGNDNVAELCIRSAAAQDSCQQRPEAFGFRFHSNGSHPRMDIVGYDELGLVYGILEFSKKFLGVEPFWFWADQSIVQ